MPDRPLSCDHCGLQIPLPDLVEATINGTQHIFCCRGCEGAYRIICGAGLDDFYRKRNWEDPGLPQGAFETQYDDEYLEKFVHRNSDEAEISILLEGLRCAACVWLNERVLTRLDACPCQA